MYVILRSTASEQVQLLAQPWMVRKLPPSVLQRGPWKIVGRCDEARLKLHYRRALDREGYCVFDAKTRLYRPDHVLQDCH
jgi:hypothetical protein